MVSSQLPQRLIEIGAAAAVDVGTIDNAHVAFAIGDRSVSLHILRITAVLKKEFLFWCRLLPLGAVYCQGWAVGELDKAAAERQEARLAPCRIPDARAMVIARGLKF